jgi:hypothetical protein
MSSEIAQLPEDTDPQIVRERFAIIRQAVKEKRRMPVGVSKLSIEVPQKTRKVKQWTTVSVYPRLFYRESGENLEIKYCHSVIFTTWTEIEELSNLSEYEMRRVVREMYQINNTGKNKKSAYNCFARSVRTGHIKKKVLT